MGEFTSPDDLVHAARQVHERGYNHLDSFSPFPVHGIDEAMGVPRSRLSWIVVGGATLGALSAQLLIWWTGAVDYPLVIGGKPLYAWEFSIPVTFELTVLFSAFAAVFGMFFLNGLPRLHHPVFQHSAFYRASDDRFLLLIEASDPMFEAEESQRLLRSVGAHAVEVVEQ